MDTKENTKRVLQIVSSMDRGGAETLIMNIYRNVDRSKIQFDFITHTTKNGEFDDEIISLGGRIFRIPSLGELGPIRYLLELKKVMSTNHYIAIHSHTDYQGGFPALAAKLSGINKRICHSHSNNWPKGNKYKEQFTLLILKILIKLTATNYCSCSKEAGGFLFGRKWVDQSKVTILKNGIDIGQFIAIDNSRDSVINELKLPKEVKIIGHVGKFSHSKNHLFLLKLLKKILESDPTFVALLIGDGPLKRQIEKEAEKHGLVENIRFLGVRADIPKLMKAFDVFVFPSFFEGFGIVTLEAQCAGTPCVVSDTIPKTTDMGLDLLSFISLDEDLPIWIQEIKKAALINTPDNETITNSFLKNGYSIKDNVSEWLSLYLKDNENSSSKPDDYVIRS
jgi:glycosyltransferase EpsF